MEREWSIMVPVVHLVAAIQSILYIYYILFILYRKKRHNLTRLDIYYIFKRGAF